MKKADDDGIKPARTRAPSPVVVRGKYAGQPHVVVIERDSAARKPPAPAKRGK